MTPPSSDPETESSNRKADLDELVARSMEADRHLLPLLPELLADLQALGTLTKHVVSALDAVGIEPGAAVLDLGCGKGAVAVVLADTFDVQIEGIDAFAPFLESARTLAAERGVQSRCVFRQDDIRNYLGTSATYDAVLLLGIGPVSGNHQETMGDLRRLVRPGGYIVIEDVFLADDVAPLPENDGYVHHAEMLRRLTAHGDVLRQEVVYTAEETRAMNEKNTALIRRRARQLIEKHPDQADAIEAYVHGQEHESDVLGTELICAVWVLERTQVT